MFRSFFNVLSTAEKNTTYQQYVHPVTNHMTTTAGVHLVSRYNTHALCIKMLKTASLFGCWKDRLHTFVPDQQACCHNISVSVCMLQEGQRAQLAGTGSPKALAQAQWDNFGHGGCVWSQSYTCPQSQLLSHVPMDE